MREFQADHSIDELLAEAGAHWRDRQVFETVELTPRRIHHTNTAVGLFNAALGLVAVVAVLGAVVIAGPLRLVGLPVLASPSSGSVTPTSAPQLLAGPELEAAKLQVIAAVNSDLEHFGVPYVADDGVLVLQYFDEDARAAVEAQMPAGLEVRWEKIDYSRSELRRIASEIAGLNLDGVFAISSGTVRNRVVVKVGPSGSVDVVRQALARYGAAVEVETSSDVPVVLPGTTTETP
jgi:hypothetical protein